MPKGKPSRPEMSWIESRQEYRKRIKLASGKPKDIYGKTKQEVRDQIDDIRAQEKQGLVVGDATTLAQYTETWWAFKKKGLSKSSIGRYLTMSNKHILPLLGEKPLRDIKPSDVRQLLADRGGSSRDHQSKMLSTLRQIFDSALADGLVARNPCDGVSPGGAQAKEKEPLTDSQQKTLLKAAKGEHLELFIMLCLYAGLRREEALGLQWDNVHLGATPYIDVRHAWIYPDETLKDVLKSDAARRTIPLPSMLAAALKKEKQKAGFVVAPKVSGGGLPQVSFRRYWKSIMDTIGVNEDQSPKICVTPHILRHTYITQLCASGMDIRKIQYLAGHRDPHMTLRVYTHVTQNRPQELISAVEGAFSAKHLGVNLGVKGIRYRVKKKNTAQLSHS